MCLRLYVYSVFVCVCVRVRLFNYKSVYASVFVHMNMYVSCI